MPQIAHGGMGRGETRGGEERTGVERLGWGADKIAGLRQAWPPTTSSGEKQARTTRCTHTDGRAGAEGSNKGGAVRQNGAERFTWARRVGRGRSLHRSTDRKGHVATGHSGHSSGSAERQALAAATAAAASAGSGSWVDLLVRVGC